MEDTKIAPAVDAGGLTMMIDPRWIVAVPGNDVDAEVELQLGPRPEGEPAESWGVLRRTTTGMLQRALDHGARWAGMCLIRDRDGSVVLVRAVVELRSTVHADAPVTIEQLHAELLDLHRDDDRASTVELVSTQLGETLRETAFAEFGVDGLGEIRAYYAIVPGAVLAVQCLASRVGWSQLWGPMLEAMVLSLHLDPRVPAGSLQMTMTTVGGDL